MDNDALSLIKSAVTLNLITFFIKVYEENEVRRL